MTAFHRLTRTWTRAVDLYYTLTQFARQKLIATGIPPERIRVKPNFISPDPGPGTGAGGYAIFAARFAGEKGLDTMLEAWSQLRLPIQLKVIGDGPLRTRVFDAVQRDSRIEWLGRVPQAEVMHLMGDAAVLIQPSNSYETFGRTIIEAAARGTPAIISGHGAMHELVDDGRTGLCYRPGDASDLRAKVESFFSEQTDRQRMRAEARAEYLKLYTAEPNYRVLCNIYEEAIRLSGQRRKSGKTAANTTDPTTAGG